MEGNPSIIYYLKCMAKPISIDVIVMGIIKSEKVFVGNFILIENKLEKLKITAKTFLNV